MAPNNLSYTRQCRTYAQAIASLLYENRLQMEATSPTYDKQGFKTIGFVKQLVAQFKCFFFAEKIFIRKASSNLTEHRTSSTRKVRSANTRPIMQHHSNKIWRIRKKQMQAQRQAQTSRMQSVQPQPCYGTTNIFCFPIIRMEKSHFYGYNVSKQHVNAAQNQLEIMRKNCKI